MKPITNNRILVACCCCLLTIFGSTSALAGDTGVLRSSGTLKGKVVPTGIGATVTVAPTEPGAAQQFITPTEAGEFELSAPSGVYKVYALAEGYLLSIQRDVRVTQGQETDMGEIRLRQAGAIAGRIQSVDPEDIVIVYASRRLDSIGWDRTFGASSCALVDSATGVYKIERIDPEGTYDLAIASVRHGIRCFMESHGPVYAADAPLAKELQAQLDKRTHARSKGEIDAITSILSSKFPLSHARIRESYAKEAQKHKDAGETLVIGKDELLKCTGDEKRAVSVRNSEWKWANAVGKVRENSKRIWIDVWDKEDGEWKIMKTMPPPIYESRAKDDWLTMHYHDSQNAPPPSFGDTTVILTDKLVGIRVKAGEITTGINYNFSKDE